MRLGHVRAMVWLIDGPGTCFPAWKANCPSANSQAVEDIRATVFFSGANRWSKQNLAVLRASVLIGDAHTWKLEDRSDVVTF
jgi:hypothetical protein